MVQTTNRFFDEVARLMNDAAGAAQGVRREVETLFRNQAERILRDLDVMNGGEETPGIDAVVQIGIVERDRQRRLAVAIDDPGNAAGTTFGPGGPLACPRTRRRLDQIDGRHGDILV